MADIDVAPRIKCDRCGVEEDKRPATITNGKPGDWSTPDGWGRAYAGGLFANSEFGFSDLCQSCVSDAVAALKSLQL